MDYQVIEADYIARRRHLEAVRVAVEGIIEPLCKQEIAGVIVKSRTKEVDAFVKKALSGKYEDPFVEIEDMVGLRVIVDFSADKQTAASLAKQHLTIHKYEEKSFLTDAKPNEFGYDGIHLICSASREICQRHGFDVQDVESVRFELQIQSRAQNAWNDISHRFLYKPTTTLPPEIKRRLFRLVALMEIFDQEVGHAKAFVESLPDGGVDGLQQYLSQQYQEMADAYYSRPLTSEIVSFITENNDINADAMELRVIAFVNAHDKQIREMLSSPVRYSAEQLLVSQPEALLILSELDHDPVDFCLRWQVEFPLTLLDPLAAHFGYRIYPDTF